MHVRPLHERLMEAVLDERDRLASRRRVLTGSAKLAGAGAVALALAGAPGLRRVLAQETFRNDADVLNYALTLEHLEYAFYRDGLRDLGDNAFGNDPFGQPIGPRLAAIRDHEQAHVDALTKTVSDLGGEPVKEAQYNFGYTDAGSFLGVAQALENTGVSAYDGAGQFITDPNLLTTAGSIVAVEARHASYLNLLNATLPFPAAVETPLTPAEVLATASQFIAAQGTPAAATPTS